MHLMTTLKEQLGLTIIEPNETCVALNYALLPDSLVFQGNSYSFKYIFGLCKLQKEDVVNQLDYHHSTLPTTESDFAINGIDFHF